MCKAKGDHLDRFRSDQEVLQMIRRGKLVFVVEAKILKVSSRDHKACVHSDQMVLLMARWEADLHEQRPTQGLYSCKLNPKKTGMLK
jgi:hypothetical protein